MLQWFYGWCDTAGVELESRLRRRQLPTAAEITGFCRYLRTRRISEVGSLASLTEREVVDTLSPATFNFYLGVVERFLIWAAYEFVPLVGPARETRTSAENSRERLQGRSGATSLPESRSKALWVDENEIAELRAVVRPACPRNPFKPTVRFRPRELLGQRTPGGCINNSERVAESALLLGPRRYCDGVALG